MRVAASGSAASAAIVASIKSASLPGIQASYSIHDCSTHRHDSIFLTVSPQALLASGGGCFTARYQAAVDGSVPREAISDDLKLSDPDTFHGMKDALCMNSMNHDSARRITQPLCWSCRVPLSDTAAAEEARYALQIKEEDDMLFGTDASRVERSARASMERGVCARWLVHFTNAHDCWCWPTWRVVENIIKVPASISLYCANV